MTRQEAKTFIEQFVKLRNLVTDEIALQVPNLYPDWDKEEEYEINDRVLYNNVLYKVIQEHTSQAAWTPDVSVSLFTKVLIPDANIIPNWEQPDSTNPYMTGDKVMYNGKVWISTIDNNTWAPDVHGWEEIK